MLLVAIAALFILVMVVLTLTSPAKHNESLNLNLLPNETSAFNSSIMGNVTPEDLFQPSETSSTPAEQINPLPQGQGGNCTPLGDISKLMQLETKYLLYYGEEPVYIRSRLRDITNGNFLIEQDITSQMQGQSVEATSFNTYGPDGKCIQMQMSVKGMEQYFTGQNGISACSGYPFWFVCKEMLNESFFERNETVTIRGKPYGAKVYKSGGNEFWVGNDPQIFFKYSFMGNTTNKSFSAELVDITYRGFG